MLALTSVLGVRHFTSSDRPPWRFDPKHLPQVLFGFIHPKPQSYLAVLPVLEHSQPKKDTAEISAEVSTPLNEAIESFCSTFSECSAATQNKLAIKFAALNQKQKAFMLFSLASEKGHPPAQFNLGLCYEHGRGTKRDLSKAAEFYRHAAAQGHGGSLYNLALFCLEGIGGVPEDKQRSLELLDAAAQTGLTKAQRYLGLHYADESSVHQDYPKAFSYLQMAATKKDPVVHYHIGVCYERGLGVERNLVQAGQWYKSAAQQGHILAQYNLGVFYEHGMGDFPVDKPAAIRFYRMAAEAGDEEARHNLDLLRKQLEVEHHLNAKAKLNPSQSTLLFTLFHEMSLWKKGLDTRAENLKGIPRCASSPVITEELPSGKAEDLQTGNQNSSKTGQLLAF